MARTIEYDREDVLKNAMETFWEKGYSNTSIPNLVKATRLQPGSIYAAFKSKEGMFQAALEYYSQCGLKKIRKSIEQASTPLEGVKSVLEDVIEEILDDRQQRGCFLVNSLLEMAPSNKNVQKQINNYLAIVENQLFIALKSAHDLGELSQNKNPKALAKFLMVNIWGLRVLSKTDADENNMKEILAQLLLCLKA